MRALLIQQLLNVTEERMAFHLLDRLNSQHFFGLRHSSPIPDRTTPAKTWPTRSTSRPPKETKARRCI